MRRKGLTTKKRKKEARLNRKFNFFWNESGGVYESEIRLASKKKRKVLQNQARSAINVFTVESSL